MTDDNKAYTTMVFPQGFDGTTLKLNIVLIPRNRNPFDKHSISLPAPNDQAISFADLVPAFALKIVKGVSEWPIANATAGDRKPVSVAINITPATNKKALLTAIGADFGAKINSTKQAEPLTETKKTTVNKYLPETYRNAFNFTTPRVKNAKTDDSYHCAIRKDKKVVPWTNSTDLSWGHVFAHILRQPMLAKSCGMIYETSIDITDDNKALFEKGCYVYAEIVNQDYAAIQTNSIGSTEGIFIKPYAARIPKLLQGIDHKRPVFAPILFPVLFGDGIIDPEPPKAPWDQIFAELNEYNDGFAKIVHTTQSKSTELLAEAQTGSHPVKEEGIRLAWDDEQILIWYMRQLDEYKENPADPNPGVRVDAPMGVYGYRVDVKEKDVPGDWSSLNLVKSKQVYKIGDIPVNADPNEEIELPFQIFPSQIDNDKFAPFWLPMYYTAWSGKSLVLKDSDAIKIHQNDQGVEVDGAGEVKKVGADNLFDEIPAAIPLQYGKDYSFRVRMMDISGGGPKLNEELYNNSASPYSDWPFRRYVAPGLCRIQKPEDLNQSLVEFFNEVIAVDKTHSFEQSPVITLQRPTLTYPAVVFTNKYQAIGQDPVQLLIQSVAQQKLAGTVANPVQLHPAIADPDVELVEVKVEVETLRMDNLGSDTGDENYITLYTTERNFPATFDGELSIPVEFQDFNSLNLGNTQNPFDDPALTTAAIQLMEKIILPTARKIRITIRAVCTDVPDYYGIKNNTNVDLDSRYGKKMQFRFYKESGQENELLLPKAGVPELQGIYLQPDPDYVRRGKTGDYFFFQAGVSQQPDIMQRLAQQLGLKVKGLTLVGEKGQRVVFGCNNKIRHHLAPDGSSITFSTKADLCNHWIGAMVYRLNRDWAWDGLQDLGFTVSRNKKFKHDAEAEREKIDVLGDIELKHSASFESLIPDAFGNINRHETILVFIDAIEPKSGLKQPGTEELRFPDEIEVSYTLTPHFKPNHGQEMHVDSEQLDLPSTVNPHQVPKVTSVGIAFSKYSKGPKYNYTDARQKYLWVELAEPVKDPHDTVFCRVLFYAPDQLIGNNQQIAEIIKDTEDPAPPLPIDTEYIRVITPNQTDDMAGLGAMQAMEKAAGKDDLHYLLPLPAGLHAESQELFGFFTYEFRIGHGHWSNDGDKENLWSTAQGRFGRPLTIAGMQHPAPTLLCTVNRDEKVLTASAPYAKAVYEGRNVTSDPPRTQLHAVLYAQVRQADGEAYRNILLDTKLMTLVKPPKYQRPKPKASDFAEVAMSSMVRSADAWTVQKTNEVQRAQVILSNLTLMNEMSKLKVDSTYQRKINKAMSDYKTGKTVKLDTILAKNVVHAFEELKAKDKIAPVATAVITDASLLAGNILASYKDLPKTAEMTWDNKEIVALLNELGLPDDSALSVLTVEVFGNITNIIDHILSAPDEVLEKVGATGNNGNIAANILEMRRKNREALTGELGNYRILRTSPLTEVPFVCCVTC